MKKVRELMEDQNFGHVRRSNPLFEFPDSYEENKRVKLVNIV